MIMKTTIVLLVILALLVCGCSTMKNLNASDVRAPSMLRQEGVLGMTIEKALACAKATDYVCGPGGGAILVESPDGKEFSMFIYGIGLTQQNPYVIVDFREENGIAAYRGYTAMSSWSGSVPILIKRVEVCGECDGL